MKHIISQYPDLTSISTPSRVLTAVVRENTKEIAMKMIDVRGANDAAIWLRRVVRVSALVGAIALSSVCVPQAAADYSVSGNINFVSGPPTSVVSVGSFDNSSPIATSDQTAFDASNSAFSRSGQLSARAGFGSVGVTGSASSRQPAPLVSNGDSFNSVQGVALAVATIDDIIISGPGSGSIFTQLNLRLHGVLSAVSSLANEPDGSVAAAQVSIAVMRGTETLGFGTFRHDSTNGSSSQVTSTGMLTGFDGDDLLTTASFLVPLNTPTTIELQLRISLVSTLQATVAGEAAGSAFFNQTLSFSTEGDVFTLPDGYTANSVSAGIINNDYNAVPEPSTTAMLALASAGLLLVWKRRRSGARSFAA